MLFFFIAYAVLLMFREIKSQRLARESLLGNVERLEKLNIQSHQYMGKKQAAIPSNR